ncbi:MAG: hypothetical protein HFJ79_03710 [Clostridiales bacterium]|nr:hypothetical protein [Clostridiales bacterium]
MAQHARHSKKRDKKGKTVPRQERTAPEASSGAPAGKAAPASDWDIEMLLQERRAPADPPAAVEQPPAAAGTQPGFLYEKWGGPAENAAPVPDDTASADDGTAPLHPMEGDDSDSGAPPLLPQESAPRRKGPSRKKIVIGAVASAAAVLLAAAVIFVCNGGFTAVTGLISAALSSQTPPVVQAEGPLGTKPAGDDSDPAVDSPEVPVQRVFARPDGMRGAWITPGVDYLTGEGDTAQTVREQLDTAIAKLKEWNFNTVLAPMSRGERLLLPTAGAEPLFAEEPAFSPLSYLLEKARENGLFVYGVLDLNARGDAPWDPADPDGAACIRSLAAACASLAADGFLIDNYSYEAGRGASYAAYMAQAPGAGREGFTRDRVTAVMEDVVRTLRAANENAYIGLLAGGLWASSETDERGMAAAGYAELSDGHADTLSWVQGGLFDFVMAEDYESIENGDCGFQTVLDWWASVCGDAKIPLYIAHAADRAVTDGAGWKSPDQLSRQVLACKERAGWAGSAFRSLADLIRNPLNSTTVLLRAFDGGVRSEYISNQLVVSSPKKQTMTTYESTQNFQGSADPNFPLIVNGEEVELSEHGYFAFTAELSVGKNTYTFEHKGQSVTYTVTYKVQVLKSASPGENLALDGGTTITVSAIAHKDASVSAKIGGTSITMSPAPLKQNELDASISADYENFSGEYTLPEGREGESQNLGTVKISGSYKGLSESLTGGSITVNPLPVYNPGAPDDPLPNGGGKPVDPGTGGAVIASGKILTITSQYAETFSGETTDDYSRPTNAYLPQGTTDRLVKTVYDSASKNYYYLLGCGRRVYQRDAAVYMNSGNITANTISTTGVKSEGGYTTVSLKSIWHVPYNLRLLPQSYANTSTPNYAVSSVTAQYVDIRFSYTPATGSVPDVSGSPLFSSAEWLRDGNDSTLRLHLKATGGFYGYSVSWDDSGVLHFSFRHAPGSQSLQGKRIVLDPGHGGSHVGTAAGSLAEKTMTLKYALTLRDKLQAMGATVVLTRTGDVHLSTDDHTDLEARAAFARNNRTDMMISLHMDGSTSSSAYGSSVHYFYEYAQAAAQTITNRMQGVYDAYNPSGPRRGTVWNPFLVTRIHDCPAVLIECGFMTSPSNLELLINDTFRDKLTAAITDGVLDYFKAQPVSRVAFAEPVIPLVRPLADVPKERRYFL